MINARYSVNSDVDCYRARGSDYAGKAHISETGVVCKSWPSHVAKKVSLEFLKIKVFNRKFKTCQIIVNKTY